MYGENLVQLTVMVPARIAEWVKAEGGAEFSRGLLVGAYEGLHGHPIHAVSGNWSVSLESKDGQLWITPTEKYDPSTF